MGSIYKIENVVNGKCYFGQTMGRPKVRKNAHFNSLKKGIHFNKHLQDSWNKYGSSAFKFDVISDKEDDGQLDILEAMLIDIFQTMNPNFGYNRISGGHSNKKYSEESKRKMSQSKKGVRTSPKTEFKAGSIPKNKGKPRTKEVVEKVRCALIKHWSNPESGKKQSESKIKYYANGGKHPRLGKKHSAEGAERISQAKLKYYANGGLHPSKGRKGGVFNFRRVLGPDGTIYPSILQAAKAYNCRPSYLSESIKKKRPYKGLLFVLAANEEKKT